MGQGRWLNRLKGPLWPGVAGPCVGAADRPSFQTIPHRGLPGNPHRGANNSANKRPVLPLRGRHVERREARLPSPIVEKGQEGGLGQGCPWAPRTARLSLSLPREMFTRDHPGHQDPRPPTRHAGGSHRAAPCLPRVPGPNEVAFMKHTGDGRKLPPRLQSGSAFSYTGCGFQGQAWGRSLEVVPRLERRRGPHTPRRVDPPATHLCLSRNPRQSPCHHPASRKIQTRCRGPGGDREASMTSGQPSACTHPPDPGPGDSGTWAGWSSP